jgi:hypothetical protein
MRKVEVEMDEQISQWLDMQRNRELVGVGSLDAGDTRISKEE